jgi:hypothetical protein
MFMKKYPVYINTQELEVRDKLSDLDKRGTSR